MSQIGHQPSSHLATTSSEGVPDIQAFDIVHNLFERSGRLRGIIDQLAQSLRHIVERQIDRSERVSQLK